MRKTGIVKDERFMDHRPGDWHPESPRRLEVIYAMLDDADIKGTLQEVPPREAPREEIALIHSPEYVERVARTRERAFVALDPDTATSPGSFRAALLAAGGLCRAVSMVLSGELDNAFALVRPPGHHAERDCARGFCLFNNVAVGARYAQQRHSIKRVLIADWDIHHGNGTQHAFEEDPSVLYFSTHQYPHYPGSGAFQEAGRGEGAGFTMNVPLSPGHGDADFLGIFEKILKPVSLEFHPDLVLVSAGFDTYEKDPLGGMRVTPQGFAAMTRCLLDVADTCCGGRLVITLEGGYHLEGLRDSVKAVLKELADLSHTPCDDILRRGDPGKLETVMAKVSRVHHRYWRSLRT